MEHKIVIRAETTVLGESLEEVMKFGVEALEAMADAARMYGAGKSWITESEDDIWQGRTDHC